MQGQLQSTYGYGASNGVKCLIYGGSGAGKTRLAATAPSPVIFSAEKGLLTLQDFNLPFWQITTFQDLVNAHAWAFGSQEALQFQTVFIDSGSDIAEVVLKNEKTLNKDPRKAYGETQDKINGLFRDFRDLVGRNVVLLAKMEYQKDEATGAMVYGPSFPGTKLGQGAPYFFDEVFHIGRYKGLAPNPDFHALLTKANNQYVAKDRSNRLAEFEPADLGYIFNKINAR